MKKNTSIMSLKKRTKLSGGKKKELIMSLRILILKSMIILRKNKFCVNIFILISTTSIYNISYNTVFSILYSNWQ